MGSNTAYEQKVNTDVFHKARMICLVRDDFTCRMPDCGETKLYKLTAHHLIPREEGGTYDPDNLVTLCERCHGIVHAKRGGPALFRQMIGE